MLLSVLIAASLAVPPPAATAGHPFATNRGISGTLPHGWRIVHRRLTSCVDPAEVLAVSSFALPRRPRLAPDGAFLLLEERADGSEDRLPRRPARFVLRGRPSPLACCRPLPDPGWTLRFKTSGRAFYGYAYVGRRARADRRRELLRVLDGLRIERQPRVRWRASRSLGRPWAGRLVRGVRLPAWSRAHYTWDPVLRRSPDRPWRRFGSARLVRLVLRVVSDFSAESFVRVGIGDLSRPRGGDFGLRYGYPGHVSHQNGLDVDVYYPRRDGLERPPDRPGQIDRRLAQELLDRFVAAGAQRIFVGPHTGLTGPRRVVQALDHHDNHMHVRLAPRRTLGQ